jgi:hypothetical protein
MDEEDLETELEAMQQEQLDEQMLKSGTVPVSDSVHRMPAVANGESELPPESTFVSDNVQTTNVCYSQGQDTDRRGGGRRGSRASEVTGRDGHVKDWRSCRYSLLSVDHDIHSMLGFGVGGGLLTRLA